MVSYESASNSQLPQFEPWQTHPFERFVRPVPAELELRAQKLSFMFEQMGKIMDLEGSVTRDEAQGLLKYSEDHRQIMLKAQGTAFDVDHTLTHDPRLLVTEIDSEGNRKRTGDLNGENLPMIEQENLQMKAVLALSGMHVSLLTGRDVYAHPTAIYVQQKMDEFADVAKKLYDLGDSRGIDFRWFQVPGQGYSRPSTIHRDRPAVLLVGSCNGVEIRDVWNDYKRVGEHYTLSDSFWLAIAQDEELNELLHDSTDPHRREQMAQAFPPEKQSLETDVDQAITSLRRYMNVSENRGKANFVFETHQIARNEKNLQERWYKATGVLITEESKGSFIHAFNVLMAKKFGPDESYWPFETTKSISNGQRVIDVIPRGVNKGRALKDIQAYVASEYGEYYDEDAPILTNGDNHMPGANDNLMLENIPGSVSCSGNPKHGVIEYDDGQKVNWPILLRELSGMADEYNVETDEEAKKKYSVLFTNQYLKDLVLMTAFRHNQASQLPAA